MESVDAVVTLPSLDVTWTVAPLMKRPSPSSTTPKMCPSVRPIPMKDPPMVLLVRAYLPSEPGVRPEMSNENVVPSSSLEKTALGQVRTVYPWITNSMVVAEPSLYVNSNMPLWPSTPVTQVATIPLGPESVTVTPSSGMFPSSLDTSAI